MEKFEVVVSGMSGRFPECDDVITYKTMLYDKENPITFDNRKWPTTYKYKFGEPVPSGLGKYKEICPFDARVFAVNRNVADCTDIINRKVLEPSFEAIMDAGINPTTLSGANIGVFMMTSINEAESIKMYRRDLHKLYYVVGCSKTMQANRLSFALNLKGPSQTYHNVLGGMDALYAAYHSIAEGRVEAAIVGAATSICDPKLSLNFVRLGYLSPDSFCKAFSKDADGYGRSEATVCLYLQRAQDAKRSYGTVLFSDSFYFASDPYTYIGFEEDDIEKSFREIYSRHQDFDPSEISYLEMDASGVQRLEKIESNIVAKLFCQNRKQPLLVGSIKSHVGHTEGTSPLMSFLKVLFALDSNSIAPNMHFSEINPQLKPLVEGKMKVVTETTPLPGPTVAVNTIEITGKVGHVVVRQNPKKKTHDTDDNLPRLLLLCGRDEEKLKEVVKRIEQQPLNTDMVALANDVFKTPIPSHAYRAYTVLPAKPKAISEVEVIGGENRPVWFFFSGMGSQWNGMGKGLLDIPAFAAAIERCDKVLKPNGVDIYEILTSDDKTLFDNIVNAFVGIIAVQVGLVEVLKTVGITPDGIIGHSVGENGCAYADGCLTLEQSVLASYARGVASNEAETIRGMMAAIGQGYHQIKDTLPDGIEVACHNSSDNCTLTGPEDLVFKFVKELQDQNIFAKAVNVANIAYHSRHIAPAGPCLLKRLLEAIPEPKKRSSKWISTSVPEDNWHTSLAQYCSAEYLTNNLLSSVLFEEGCKHIPDNAIVIEIAPHGLFQAILKRSLKPTVTNISLTRRSTNPDPVNFLLSAIGKLYISGQYPDVNALHPKIEYPVPRGTPCISYFATWDHTDLWDGVEPLQDLSLSEEIIKLSINEGSQWHYLRGHKIKGQCIIPPSVYLYLTWQMVALLKNDKIGNFNIVFENIKIHRNLYVTMEKYRPITIKFQNGSGNFEITLENEKNEDNIKLIMTGNAQIPYETRSVVFDEDQIQQMKVTVTQTEFYKNLENIGYQIKDDFVNVKELAFNETECFGKIIWKNDWVLFLDSLMKVHMYSESNFRKEVPFPYRLRRLYINVKRFQSLKPGDEIVFHKDLVTKRLQCQDVEFMDFKCAPLNIDFPDVDEVPAKLQSLHFIPHAKPDLPNVKEFLTFCLQIAAEKILALPSDSKSNLHVIDTIGDVVPLVKKIFKSFNYKLRILHPSIKDVLSAPPAPDNFYLLIANNFVNADKIYNQLSARITNVFLLVIQPIDETSPWKSKHSFVKLSSEIFDHREIHFYKNASPNNEHTIPKIIADDDWMANALELKNTSEHPIVVVRKTVETTDLNLILSARKQYPNTRFLYMLDDDVADFSDDNVIYKDQIIKDLPVSVYKDGQWGSYRNLICDVIHGYEESNLKRAHELQLKSVDIAYLNFDHQKIAVDEDTDVQENEYGLEYSGISETGKRIMGLGYHHPLEAVKEPDTLLTWNVPETWSLEDAATVPLIYAQAFYCIFLRPIRNETHSVFVNSTLAMSEACVAICLNHDYPIYVTVDNDHEARILKKKFPTFNEKHILSRDNYKYELQLRFLTGGKGVKLAINSYYDGKHMDACLNCLGEFGQYFELVDEYISDDLQLGLNIFLRSTSFYVVPNKIAYFAKLPIETKKLLHECIEEGIKTKAIQPLTKVVIEDDSSTEYLRKNQNEKIKKIHKIFNDDILNDYTSSKLKYDDSRSFLIISGGKKTNVWFELLEWLIKQGAKKFIVALDNFSLGTKVSHQINRLLVQKKTTIILTSFKKTESVTEASNLIKEANNIAPLEAVFFVSLDPATNIVHNIDIASRSMNPFHFVCLLSGGLKQCEQRRQAGLPALLIHSEKSINKLSNLLPRLESLLKSTITKYSPTVYHLVDKSNREGNDSLSIRLSNYVPNDIEGLEDIGYHATDETEFFEVATRSPNHADAKGVFPIFVIPATDTSHLKTLLSNLFHPAFCATFTEKCESATSIATKLCKDVLEIQPYGPVNIIGETWSGAIAIELGSLIQKANRAVHVFLIEGSPASWQKHIKSLGGIDTPQFNKKIIKQILYMDPATEISYESENNCSTWEENLQKYMKYSDYSDNMKKNIIKTLNGVRNRLIMTAKYKPEGELLRQITLFKQRPLESALDTYCISDEIHLIEEEKYKEFVKIKEISTIINDNAIFSWWR